MLFGSCTKPSRKSTGRLSIQCGRFCGTVPQNTHQLLLQEGDVGHRAVQVRAELHLGEGTLPDDHILWQVPQDNVAELLVAAVQVLPLLLQSCVCVCRHALPAG